MTPDKIALDVVRQLRWDNDTRWHEIIAAAIAAERAEREKAEAERDAARADALREAAAIFAGMPAANLVLSLIDKEPRDV